MPFGYSSFFLYGGDTGFDNMNATLKDGSFENVYGVETFDESLIIGKWGVPDGIMLSRFASLMEKAERPFLATCFTLTSHEPFDLPPDYKRLYEKNTGYEGFLNTIHYTDSCLMEFFKTISKQSYYDSTIFVLAADHNFNGIAQGSIPKERFHIFGLIIPSLLIENNLPQKTDRICSQTDLIPTILDIAKIPATHKSFGKSIYAPDSTGGFALIEQNNIFGLITFSGMAIYDHKSDMSSFVPSGKDTSSDWQSDALKKLLYLSQSSMNLLH